MTENSSRRALIGSFYAQDKMMSTQLLRWYLEKGLIIEKVDYVLSYLGKRAFRTFADKVVNMRRQAAISGDTNSKRVSLMFKLMGNRYRFSLSVRENVRNTVRQTYYPSPTP